MRVLVFAVTFLLLFLVRRARAGVSSGASGAKAGKYVSGTTARHEPTAVRDRNADRGLGSLPALFSPYRSWGALVTRSLRSLLPDYQTNGGSAATTALKCRSRSEAPDPTFDAGYAQTPPPRLPLLRRARWLRLRAHVRAGGGGRPGVVMLANWLDPNCHECLSARRSRSITATAFFLLRTPLHISVSRASTVARGR